MRFLLHQSKSLVSLDRQTHVGADMFFPCFCNPHASPQDYKKFKLKNLKAMRDFFEARLAATNAEIETVERQISMSEGSEAA